MTAFVAATNAATLHGSLLPNTPYFMLQLTHLGLRRANRLLFEDASLQIHPGHKVGLTGANGSGKSSLFALILDELHADAGDLSMPTQWVIAHVAQATPADTRTAIEYVLDGDAELRDIESHINAANASDDGMLLARLHTELENIHGYSARSRAATLLHGLGFKPGDETRSVNHYSGGWRMRLNLARALMCRSDLLLLDEPTNHLDLDAVIWLENWLRSYSGTLIIISHDRDFLDNVCNQIAHIEQQRITLYSGNYTAFERIRAERLANQQAAFVKQQREISHIQSYVDRFRAQATKARQAQSRLKALERMQQIAPAHVDSPFQFSLLAPRKQPDLLLTLDTVSAGYATHAIIEQVNMSIAAGERIGLLGPNGAGKSTFIKLLADSHRADAPQLLKGKREYHKDICIGYFAQHQLEQLHPEHTAVEHLQQLDKQARESELRNFLGGFGFSNERALEPVAPFSGGEKSRLVLAMLVYQRPNLLLLDEPTNHLDIEMRQALAVALQEFSGAMVIVSHDRHLLRVCCDKLLLVHNQCVEEFSGSLDDYPKWLSDQQKQVSTGETSAGTGGTAQNALARKDLKRQQAEQRQQLQPLRKEISRLETQLDELHARQQQLEAILADPNSYADSNKAALQKLLLERAELNQRGEKIEEQWLIASEKLEAAIQ
jgi:ATP-binding cassette subfamily F protein 3